MKELHEIAAWLAETSPYKLDFAESLPSPTFRANGRKHLSFSSNNYLGLAASPRLIAAARNGLERYGVGNCESRLLGGNLEIYDALERKLAKLKHKESAVLFATGYLANLGVLSSLPASGKFARAYGYPARDSYNYAYFSDQFNHLSIREGIRMSGAERRTYRHCDLGHLETLLRQSSADMRIIVSDGVFSQDGDIADLPGLLALGERYDAMVYIDDAHGTGVLGQYGAGTSEHFGVSSPRLIQMGTLSKAYGAIGGFIATEAYIAEIIRLSCSAYGFTSSLPPDQTVAVSEAIDAARDEPERRTRLWANQKYFVTRMAQLPFTLVSTATPIVPVLIGDEVLTDRFAGLLQAESIHVDAVQFPAVPIGKSRLRIQLNAGHTRAQIDQLVDILNANQDLLGGEKSRPHMVASSREASDHSLERPWSVAAFGTISQAKKNMAIGIVRLFSKASSTFVYCLGSMNLQRYRLGTSLNIVTFATAILLAVDIYFDIPHLIFAYLLPILFVAVKFGRVPALLVVTVSVLCAAFFLFEPVLSFSINDPQDKIELMSFCAIGLLISHFVGRYSDNVLIAARSNAPLSHRSAHQGTHR